MEATSSSDDQLVKQFNDAPNSFYIGAHVDAESGDVAEGRPVYLNPQDLRTHAVILGMTGSGKTGLGMTLLEEAAIDGIPQIIIDPKGDMTNLLLSFPEFSREHFQPWVNPDDVPQGTSLEEYAEDQAEAWQEGIERWGIDNKRVQTFRRSARFSIYTPGSDAGLPVRILSSFEAPKLDWETHHEALRERITRMVSALLRLIGSSDHDVEDPPHILLANIFEHNWRRNVDLTLRKLILQVQNPPFDKLGVMDVNTVISEKDRMALGKELNHLIAAPHFENWLTGRPLDIGSMLYTEEGYPRTSVLYTAHLGEGERQFVTTLLLEAILGWVQGLSGSANLRALVYIDEVHGMLPPHPYNPPTKPPLMRLLKQARAFGVGTVLSTQNPHDLDYKGLANTGIWMLGKLQTDNDKRRALEALDTSNAEGMDVGTIRERLGQLNTRQFVMHNIHDEDSPFMFETRHVMSYMRGPLNREQIRDLMASQRDSSQWVDDRVPNTVGMGPSSEMAERSGRRVNAVAAEVAPSPEEMPPEEAEIDLPGFSPVQPSLHSHVDQYYMPVEYTPQVALRQRRRGDRGTTLTSDDAMLMYRPALVAQATVRFKHGRTNTTEMRWHAFTVPQLPRMQYIEWNQHQTAPFDPETLDTSPMDEAHYADLPKIFHKRTTYTALRNSLEDWLYANLQIPLYHAPEVDMYSRLDEPREAFYERVVAAARDRRNVEIDHVAERYDRRLANLERQIQRKTSRLDAESGELDARQMERTAAAGEALLRLVRGSLYRTISEIAEVSRQTEVTDERVEVLQEDLNHLQEQVETTIADMEREIEEVNHKWSRSIEEMEEGVITPNKSDINIVFFGLTWVPYWGLRYDDDVTTLPATPSGLADEQLDIYGEQLAGMLT